MIAYNPSNNPWHRQIREARDMGQPLRFRNREEAEKFWDTGRGETVNPRIPCAYGFMDNPEYDAAMHELELP